MDTMMQRKPTQVEGCHLWFLKQYLENGHGMMQIKTIWSVLLRNFEFEKVDPFPLPDLDSMVVGPKACRIRYRRRKQPL